MKKKEYEIIMSCARTVGYRFRIQPEELIGEGYLALLETQRTFQEKKGKKEHHLRKGVRLRLYNYIRKYERELEKYTKEDKDYILNSIPDTHDKEPFDFLNHITLTADCLEIIMVVKLNLDFLEEKRPKEKFTRYLRNRGWSLKRIHDAYRELKNILKKGR